MRNPGTQGHGQDGGHGTGAHPDAERSRNGRRAAVRTAAGDATTRAAVTMRTMAPGFRHAAVIRRAAMVAGRNNGVRHRRNVLRALRVLACRRAAHGEEREQTGKKETAQKNHATWGNELTELMRIIISHGRRHDARAAMNNLYPIMAHAKALAANSYGILMLSGIVKVDFLAGGKVLGYYNARALSYGLQAGAKQYLDESSGWSIGSGTSVVIVGVSDIWPYYANDNENAG